MPSITCIGGYLFYPLKVCQFLESPDTQELQALLLPQNQLNQRQLSVLESQILEDLDVAICDLWCKTVNFEI